MENQTIEKSVEQKLQNQNDVILIMPKEFAPTSKFFFKMIAKKQRLVIDPQCAEKKYTALKDAFAITDLSARYMEVILTKKHLDKNRVLSTSKSVRANNELPYLMQLHQELIDFNLSDGDPGALIAPIRLLTGPEALAAAQGDPTEMFLNFDLENEIQRIIIVTSIYTFYKSKKKKFPIEFSSAESNLKSMAKQYSIAIRLSWNAKTDNASKKKLKKTDQSFFKNYGNSIILPPSPISNKQIEREG